MCHSVRYLGPLDPGTLGPSDPGTLGLLDFSIHSKESQGPKNMAKNVFLGPMTKISHTVAHSSYIVDISSNMNVRFFAFLKAKIKPTVL